MYTYLPACIVFSLDPFDTKDMRSTGGGDAAYSGAWKNGA